MSVVSARAILVCSRGREAVPCARVRCPSFRVLAPLSCQPLYLNRSVNDSESKTRESSAFLSLPSPVSLLSPISYLPAPPHRRRAVPRWRTYVLVAFRFANQVLCALRSSARKSRRVSQVLRTALDAVRHVQDGRNHESGDILNTRRQSATVSRKDCRAATDILRSRRRAMSSRRENLDVASSSFRFLRSRRRTSTVACVRGRRRRRMK